MIELLRAWRRGTITPAQRLLLGQFVMFTGIAAVFPVVPIYVAHRGGTAVDIVIFVAGPMIANTLVQVPAGRLVDRIGRKPVMVAARVVFAVLSLLLFIDAGPLWFLGLLRCLQGASGGAYVPALRSALADTTPPERRGTIYAQLQAVEMTGLLIGPLLGGFIALWRDAGIFGCSGLGVLLGMATLLRYEDRVHHDEDGDVPAGSRWWWRRGLLIPAVGVAVTGAMFSMYDVVWPQYLNARGYSTLIIGLSESLFAVPIILLAGYGGRLSDRGNRRVLVGASFTLVAACTVTYPSLRSIWPILGVGVVEAIAFVLIEPTLFATISESADARIRGRAMGLGGLFQFGGSAVGAAVLGSLYGAQPSFPFIGGAALCLLAGSFCALTLPPRPGAAAAHPMDAAIDLESRV